MQESLFDSWTEKYDCWFATPVGRQVRRYESALLLQLLAPQEDELILDVGCGTGIFTKDVLTLGSKVIGIDLSYPMLHRAMEKTTEQSFLGLCADMSILPFATDTFDRVYSMTAIEFVADAAPAINELERVTKKGGTIVVTTLNDLSPWAKRRRNKAVEGHSLFNAIHFRTPAQMRELIPLTATIKTAIHFEKESPLSRIPELERIGSATHPENGAFLAVQWRKR